MKSDKESDLENNVECDAMLNDAITSNAYHQFFRTHDNLFKDKIVLDVGCRSGMLSLMAVEVGAIKVIALGNMESAKFVQKALDGGEKEDIFEMINGCVQEIRLPCGLKKVDIIVSEWVGNAIFTESLFRDVIYARDKWLVKGGLIVPNVATLYMAGITNYVNVQAVNKSKDESDIVLEDYVKPVQLVTHRFRIKTLNLSVATSEDEYFRTTFKLHALRDGEIQGFVLHFDVALVHAKQKWMLFSIGPRAPKTYLKQTLLFLEDTLMVKKHEILEGFIGMCANESAERGVELSLGMKKTDVRR